MRSYFSWCVLLLSVCSVQATRAQPAESIPGVDTVERVIEVSDGARLQALITRPQGESRPLPPLLFTQWVSCGSVTYRRGSNARELLAALARESGLSLVRVERSALAGSGPDCEALDYDTEVSHYIEAFTRLLGDKYVDASRVYVYGSSLGATTAPLVAAGLQARGFDIAGVMVQGGGAVTHFERMLNFERNYLERRPDVVDPDAVHDEIYQRHRFQYEYLVVGRHPDEVARDGPAMARIRKDTLGLGESDHYGRPFRWHQQAAQRNFLAAWADLDAPVLVLFNSFDQYEQRHGHWLIAETVNRRRPGTATFIERPGIGHNDYRYTDIDQAYAQEQGAPAWHGSAQIMLDWLQRKQ